MKKYQILVLLFFVFTAQINAQIFRLGVKGGANISKVTGSSFNDKFESGYHIGAFAQIKLAHKFVFQPEVLLSQVNTKVDSNFHNIYSDLSYSYLKNVQLKYLSIPLVLNYKINSLIALQGGVQYSKLMNSDSSLISNGKSAFKNGDMGLLTGIQIQFGHFLVNGRYIIGLNNLNDIDNKDKWKSQNFQIGVGLRL